MGGSVGDFGKDLFNKDVVNPEEAKWGDLSGSEKGARIAGGALSGLGKGLQNYQQQNAAMRQGGGAAPIQVTPNPQVATNFDPNYLDAWYRGFGGR